MQFQHVLHQGISCNVFRVVVVVVTESPTCSPSFSPTCVDTYTPPSFKKGQKNIHSTPRGNTRHMLIDGGTHYTRYNIHSTIITKNTHTSTFCKTSPPTHQNKTARPLCAGEHTQGPTVHACRPVHTPRTSDMHMKTTNTRPHRGYTPKTNHTLSHVHIHLHIRNSTPSMYLAQHSYDLHTHTLHQGHGENGGSAKYGCAKDTHTHTHTLCLYSTSGSDSTTLIELFLSHTLALTHSLALTKVQNQRLFLLIPTIIHTTCTPNLHAPTHNSA